MLHFAVDDKSCQTKSHDNCGEFDVCLGRVIVAWLACETRLRRRYRTGTKQPLIKPAELMLGRTSGTKFVGLYLGLYRSFAGVVVLVTFRSIGGPLASVGSGV